MNKLISGVIAIVALVLLILYMLGIIGSSKVEPGSASLPSAKLSSSAQTTKVVRQEVDDVLSWPGTVRSRSKARIAPKMTARILDIKVKAGDRVRKGDVIARLDNKALRAQERRARAALAAAKADAERAKADERRIRALFAKEAATRETFDGVISKSKAAHAAVEAAYSALGEIRANKADTTLKAPFDGVIIKRLKEPGDMGVPGAPIVAIHTTNALRLEAAVPTYCARFLTVGTKTTVRIETLNLKLAAEIDEIIPEVDPQTRTILIKTALPPTEGLQPGLFGWLDQACSKHEALLIPKSAVRRIGQLEVVKVLSDGNVFSRHVRTGKSHDQLIEIQSGLHEDEVVVVQ